MYPYNHKIGQKIQTDVGSVSVDRSFIAHFQIEATKAVAASNIAVLEATALTASAQVISENITNPAVPRNLKIVGNSAGIAGDVTIKGTNYDGDAITETVTLNGTTAVEGAKAFKTVAEIDLPIQTAAGNTVSVGIGEKLGLPYKLSHNTVLAAYLDNVKEATIPTVMMDGANIEGNTIDLNSALNSKVVDVYLIV